MNWKTKYYGKLATQKVLGAVPGLYSVQEAVKLVTGRLEARVDAEFVARRFEEKVAQFMAAGVAPPRIVLEQGTGWHGADLVLFHLAGAERILTYDVRPWLRLDILRVVARQAQELAPTVARWTGDEEGPRERAAALTALTAVNAPPGAELLGALRATYRVTRSMRRDAVPAGSVDLFYSDSVLQRATPRDLALLLREGARALASDGSAHHVVDCKDFHAIDDTRVPELGYLRPTERSWRALTSRYLNYQNRLRMPQFVRLMREAGLDVQTLAERRTPENVAFARTVLAGHPLWHHLTPEDVATSRFEVVGRRASVAPAAAIVAPRPAPRPVRSLTPAAAGPVSHAATPSGART